MERDDKSQSLDQTGQMLALSPSMGHAIWRTTTRFSSPTGAGSSTSTLSVAPRANAAGQTLYFCCCRAY